MPKLVVVIGATGAQGGSVVSALADDASYQIRAVTRNTNSDKAKALAQRGIGTVAADVDDEESLVKAFAGASIIFAVTDFYEAWAKGIGAKKGMELEYQRGLNLARAASKTKTLDKYIWSTLPNGGTLSGGKAVVPHFDAKAQVDDFIKSDKALLAKTLFVYFGFYPANLFWPIFTPFFAKPGGKYLALTPVHLSTKIASLGPTSNAGIAVKALLETPYPKSPTGPSGGRYAFVKTGVYDISEYYSIWGKASGKGDTQVLQVPLEQYEALFGMWGNEAGTMMKMWELVGEERSWTTVGEGDVLIDIQELEGVSDKLLGLEAGFKQLNFDSI